MSVYTDNGYKNRKDYLDSLAEDYCMDKHSVYVLADVLGPTEDFDGLVSSLEDFFDAEEYLDECNLLDYF